MFTNHTSAQATARYRYNVFTLAPAAKCQGIIVHPLFSQLMNSCHARAALPPELECRGEAGEAEKGGKGGSFVTTRGKVHTVPRKNWCCACRQRASVPARERAEGRQ